MSLPPCLRLEEAADRDKDPDDGDRDDDGCPTGKAR